MRTKRPMRTSLSSPRASRRRTVLGDTLRIATASLTGRKPRVGERGSDWGTVAWEVVTGRQCAIWDSCAQAGTTAVRLGGFGSRFIMRIGGISSKRAIQLPDAFTLQFLDCEARPSKAKIALRENAHDEGRC